jgi:hypothetical protein
MPISSILLTQFRRFTFLALASLPAVSLAAGGAPVANWDRLVKDGDLIFQRSQSAQAAALEEGTGSIWTHVGTAFKNGKAGWQVFEASRTVTMTPIDDFVRRGKNGAFVIKRLASGAPGTKELQKLRSSFAVFAGKPYDIFFEWNNQRIYCSELVWKGYVAALGVEIGKVQRFKDIRLDGPEVRRLIDERLTRIGKKVDLEEEIITPVAMFEAPNLVQVHSQGKP